MPSNLSLQFTKQEIDCSIYYLHSNDRGMILIIRYWKNALTRPMSRELRKRGQPQNQGVVGELSTSEQSMGSLRGHTTEEKEDIQQHYFYQHQHQQLFRGL